MVEYRYINSAPRREVCLMLYSVIRIILALAGAAVAFIMVIYGDEERKYNIRSFDNRKAWIRAGITFLAAVILLHLIPVENFIIGFSKPEKAFHYNNTGEVLEINQYPGCAFVIASTGDEKITTHVIPERKDGKWSLETIYNRKRDVTTVNYCIIERLYVPGTNNCFVIISHNTEGNISDVPTGVIDSRNTEFIAVDYPDRVPFYYGFIEEMSDDYILYIDGNIAIGRE